MHGSISKPANSPSRSTSGRTSSIVEGGNKSGTHWILGYKTENAKLAMSITGGGSTELFGAMFSTSSLEMRNRRAAASSLRTRKPASVSPKAPTAIPCKFARLARAETMERMDKDGLRRGEAVNCAFFSNQ